MRKKIKMSTADGDEINLGKVYCPAAIDDSSRTDPKVIWQFFANNGDSLARCKMTPTCTVNRKITRLRNISGDAVEEIVLKVRKKRRRIGVTTLLPEQLQLRKLCAGQTDILESGAGDCKKKKKKKRVNKSVKRRRAKEEEVLNITMAGLKNPLSGQLVELSTDCTGLVSSRDSSGIYDESTVTVTVHGAGASAALKVQRCTDTDDDVWSPDKHSFLNKCGAGHGRISSLSSLAQNSSSAFPIENCRTLQCRIVACSWDTDKDTEPTSTLASTSICSSKRPLTLTVQDRLLVLTECSCVGGSECGPGPVREHWVLGSDMEEICLLNPDADRLALITASSSTSTSISTSTVGSEIAFREKAKSVSLNIQLLSKSDAPFISQSQSELSAVTSLDNGRRNEAEDTGIFNGTFSLSEIGITQQPVIESTSSSVKMLSKGANKKRRKAKGKGKEKGMGINCLQSQLGPSCVDHSDMQSTPTTSTPAHSQSNVMSLSPTLPCVRESNLPGRSSFTEAEKSTTECNMSLTILTDTDPTCQEHFIAAQSSSFLQPPLSPASSNREDEDDYSASTPVPVAVSFADMFESLLSKKRKLIQEHNTIYYSIA